MWFPLRRPHWFALLLGFVFQRANPVHSCPIFSAPDALLDHEVNRRLFPDTCYQWVSGGDPVHIPELNWEAFAKAHKQWYNAANALIVLDGALDLQAAVAILDEALSRAAFLCEPLGALETGATPAAALPRKVRATFGSLQSRVEAYGEAEDFTRYRVFFCVSASMLNAKAAQGADLLCELLTDTRFHRREKQWEILRQRRTELTRQISESGNSFAMTRAEAAFRTECAVQEHAGGIACLQWLQAQEAQGPDALEALADQLETLMHRLFTRARLTVSVISDEEVPAGILAGRLAESLPAGDCNRPDDCAVTWPAPAKEGFVLPSDIAFAAMSGPFPDANRGTARMMKRVVYLDHLWNNIRVQGGAYGTGMVLRNNGLASLSSFRDPEAAHSLACYRAIPAFLRDFSGDMSGAILGAVAENDPLRTPRTKARPPMPITGKGSVMNPSAAPGRRCCTPPPMTWPGTPVGWRNWPPAAPSACWGPAASWKPAGRNWIRLFRCERSPS